MASSRPAKFTIPRQRSVVERSRLIDRIDAMRGVPGLWFAGAPGSGKTTLSATWLAKAKVQSLWFRVDAADNDPAELFHSLSDAASITARRRLRLPAFAAEHEPRTNAFARRYFRALFARIPAGSVVVFDNAQELDEATLDVLAIAIEEVPSGMQVWIASRAIPSKAFAGLEASGALEVIAQNELDFTVDELRALLPDEDDDAVLELHRRTGGWSAGVALASRHGSIAGVARGVQVMDDDWRDAIFRFFAHAVLDAMSFAEQRVLMLAALFAEMKVDDVGALTDDVDAGRVLASCWRRNLFTTCRRGSMPSYRFHALFREFLLDEARVRLPLDDLLSARVEAADLLVAGDDVAEAMQVLADGGLWQRAAAILVRAAPRLLEAGRHATLRRWGDALVSQHAVDDGWLLFHIGEARSHEVGLASCDWFDRAYRRFETDDGEAHASLGRALTSATAIAVMQIAEVTYKDFAMWAERLAQSLASLPSALSPGDDLAIAVATAACSMMGSPIAGNEAVRANIDRVVDLLEADPSAADRRLLNSACTVLYYCQSQRDEALFERIRSLVEPRLCDERESVLMRVRWWVQAAACYGAFAATSGGRRLAMAHEAAREARSLAEREELSMIDFELLHLDAHLALLDGDEGERERLLLAAGEHVDLARPYQVQEYCEELCGLHLQRGRLQDALRAAHQGREAMTLAASPAAYRYNLLRAHAWTLIALDRCDEAIAEIEAFAPQLQGRNLDTIGALAALARAWAVRDEPALYRVELARGLEAVARAQSLYFMLYIPQVAARLCRDALELGIETEFVRDVIARRGLVPPADAGASWPWRIRIRVLGRFELSVGNAPVVFGPKTPRRQVELIQAIAASGPAGLETWRAVDWLWPEGDAGKNSLDVTVHRVRRLLEEGRAITVREARLVFDRSLVWTDVAEFDALVSSLQPERLDSLTDDAIEAAIERLLALYRGPLIAESSPTAWIAIAREQFEGRYERAMRALGQQLERRHRWARAVETYAQALAHNPLSEELYRGEIRSHLAMGQVSDALAAYRRCRHMLSVVLGIAPAGPTSALVRGLITHE